ncbi:MAG: hypothetical protein NYU90_07035 [Aigarchaeota archaeon]|nr:hypothetical protein [Candidatus Calditenuis fumarioli]
MNKRGSTLIDPLVASKYFLINTLINVIASALVAAPVLVAPLALPLKLTVWPGTWMFVAYAVFVGFGTIGALCWSVIYYLAKVVLGVSALRRRLVVTHLLTHNAAAYGIGALMGYAVGYVGGTAAMLGFGQAVITALVSWAVIPIGLMVFIGLLSALLGVFALVDGAGRSEG